MSVAIGVSELVDLDRRVDAAEGEGIMARWEFGRELLARRVGKKLPDGLLDELVEVTGKSRAELQRRVQFAEKFSTEEALSHVCDNHGSWHDIVAQALPAEPKVYHSSESDEWATPQELYDMLDAEFGFEVDVCASVDNAKCATYFTQEDDGLSQEWRGICWMNPPYSAIADWMQKAFESSKDGATVVCLVPARTDTAWWWNTSRYGEVRFLKGRLKFGESTNSAPFPSSVVVFGPGVEEKTVYREDL